MYSYTPQHAKLRSVFGVHNVVAHWIETIMEDRENRLYVLTVKSVANTVICILYIVCPELCHDKSILSSVLFGQKLLYKSYEVKKHVIEPSYR